MRIAATRGCISPIMARAPAVASEPASHEYLALTPDETAFVSEETLMMNIEGMVMTEVEKVRARIDEVWQRRRRNRGLFRLRGDRHRHERRRR